MAEDPERRCGTCARFVRIVEQIDDSGEVRRAGDCLLGVWPSPLYATSTCSQWVQRGQFKARPADRRAEERSGPRTRSRSPDGSRSATENTQFVFPEDLVDMDADEFRRILSEVIREELGVGEVELAGKWQGGEMILKPGKPGLQEKRIPIESLFRKVVTIRDKLRVLEQRINSHGTLRDDEKVQLQQYVTGCYGTLTTFNALFADREDQFIGQKGED